MSKLTVLVATIALVGSMAFAAQSHAEDYCTPWAGKEPRPASDWDQCNEAGSIAAGVADLRDHHVPQEGATMWLLQSWQSLQGLSLDEINRAYVSPVYESKESAHDICVEYTNACRSR
jgi:hypothetical protein